MAGILKVDRIQEANSGQGVELSHKLVDTSGNTIISENNGVATFGSSVAPSTNYTFRNKIINGDMRIDQRNAGGASIFDFSNYTNTYFMDRWEGQFYNNYSGQATFQQISTDAPLGFSNSMKISCTQITNPQDANEQLYVEQQIEGQNLNGIEWYSSTPSTLTLSFYVKSNLTGTFPLTIKLSDNNSSHSSSSSRILPLKYEINSANTWERKTVTFTLDSYSGTRIISNTFAMSILFWFAAGSSRRGNTYNVWRTNSNAATSGLDNYTFANSTNNEIYLTGIQLEEGTVPTPFEHRPIGTELSLCQRYFQKIDNGGTGNHYTNFGLATSYAAGTYTFRFPVPLVTKMRANPSFSQTGNIVTLGVVSSSTTLRPADGGGNPVYGLELSASAGASNQTVIVRGDNDPTAALNFNAEL